MSGYKFTQPTDLKLIILFIAENFKSPISNSCISDVFLTHEFADYFTLQEYIAELVRQGYLAKDDGLYVPTKLGKDSLSYFKKRVPLSVRKGILGTVKVYIRKQRLKKEVVAEVVMLNELDCAARCAVYDSNQPLFEILINAGDKATAHKICRKFKDDPKAVYTALLDCLME